MGRGYKSWVVGVGVGVGVGVSNIANCPRRVLASAGFWPREAKTRGGILGFPACIHIRNFKM